jgi:hypothetical protein
LERAARFGRSEARVFRFGFGVGERTMKSILWISALVVATATGALAQNWSVADGGTTTVISNHQGSSNYTFRNNGVDGSIVVKVIKSDGTTELSSTELPIGVDVVIGVPHGATVKVKDTPTPDSDKDGASGTF